ncbi:MAG TPA: hypothetical protein VIR38_03695 [Thalassobaculum sp.]
MARNPGNSESPQPDPWASRRRKNVAMLVTILALAALFFVVTILRMN